VRFESRDLKPEAPWDSPPLEGLALAFASGKKSVVEGEEKKYPVVLPPPPSRGGEF